MAYKTSLCNQNVYDLESQAFNAILKFSSHRRFCTSFSAFSQASCIYHSCGSSFAQITQGRSEIAPESCEPRRGRHRHYAYRDHDNCSASTNKQDTPIQVKSKRGSSLKKRSFEKGDIQLELGNLDKTPMKLECLSHNKVAYGHKIINGDMTQMGQLATLGVPTTAAESGSTTRSPQQISNKTGIHLCLIHFLKETWMCHHGSTFVLTISSHVMDGPYLDDICRDLSLLHGLGIRLVIIPGTHIQIDRLLCEKGHKPRYVGSYRVTDDAALEASMEVAGKFQLGIEAKLSSQPSIPMLRRHGDNDRFHVGVGVASGNFIAAKRRGVVDGVDFGATGEVKRLDVARIKKRLDDNCIVIVSNLGYSSSGEVLNCNTYEVATACARELQADKLISLLDGPVVDEDGRLIRFMTLQRADELIRKWAEQSETAANYVKAVAGTNYAKSLGLTKANSSKTDHGSSVVNGSVTSNGGIVTDESGNGKQRGHGLAIGGKERLSRDYGYLSELTAAVFVCRGGVQRVHLLDATIEGVLLLELYTRDGIGTMVASDQYEGTRAAEVTDLPKIEELLRPLEESGVLIKRSQEQLLKEVGSFIVVERDASIIACAALFPYYKDKCAEVAALAVSYECRGNGQGDKLLDYMENKAVGMGLKNLFLLTTRTADWFVRRGFSQCTIDCIPEQRRAKIDLTRGAKYYVKNLLSRTRN